MRTQHFALALSVVFLGVVSAGGESYAFIEWYLWDQQYSPVDVVWLKSAPDINGNCVAQYTSQPQYADNVELDTEVSLTAAGGLLMKAWALEGNEEYQGAHLRLSVSEDFAATSSGELPPDLALQINLRINGSVFVSEKHVGMCGPGYTRSNYLHFGVIVMNSANEIVSEWVSPVTGYRPRLTLAVDTDATCQNPTYWLAVDDISSDASIIDVYDNGCGVDLCPDEDLSALEYYVPFNGAKVDVSVAPTLTLPDFVPNETYRLIIHVADEILGMGALDFWNTIEFGETPFVFGTLSGETFTPLPPEEQAKLTLDSATGAMRQPNVAVDIKPGSRTNPVNRRSKGVISAAILGSEYLDVTQIDPASVKLEGTPGLRWSIRDVAAPCAGPNAQRESTESDGFDDLIVKFPTSEIAEALTGLDAHTRTRVWMTGTLQEQYGGQAIQGCDTVKITK